MNVSHLTLAIRDTFTRWTTILALAGGGHEGRGEDVAYSSDMQRVLPAHYASVPLTGAWTLGSFSQHLDSLDLVPPVGKTPWTDHPNFQRWTIESAALDLALRQAGMSLGRAVGREPRPVRFCVSMGLGSPPDASKVIDWLGVYPGLEFKLDSSNEWNDELAARLAATNTVKVIDIKGLYTGEWIDNTVDPALYRRLARGFDNDVLLEDARLVPETIEALGEEGLARLCWDYALHAPEDLDAIEHRPKAVNIKPSRFGRTSSVLAVIEW